MKTELYANQYIFVISIIFSLISQLFKWILLNINITDALKFWSVHFGEFSHQKNKVQTCIQFKFICIAPFTIQSLQSSFTGN